MEYGMPFDFPQEPSDPDEYSYAATEERVFNVAQYTNGIFPQVRIVTDNILSPTAYIGESLKVTAGTGLTVIVSPGIAMVEGTKYANTANKILTLTATTTQRIYDVVIELDLVNQKILTKAQLRATASVETALIRTTSIYQICIASVAVPASATSITIGNITDQRLNTTLCPTLDNKPVCGIVGSCLQYDYGTVVAGFEAEYNTMASGIANEWDALKGQIGTDPAFNLQSQINAVNAKDVQQDASIAALDILTASQQIQGDSAFDYATMIVARAGVTVLPSFANVTALYGQVTIPQTVTSVAGPSTFGGCTNITKVKFLAPSTISTPGVAAFSGCSRLKEILLPSGISDIGGNTFLNCAQLETINLPSAVATIDTNAFNGCTNLNYVTLGNNFNCSIILSSSTKYSVDTIVAMIAAYKPASGKTLTLGATNLAKLTTEQKAVATAKGLTLA